MGAAPLAAGDVVAGKYQVEQILGQGGMGVVFLALDTDLDRKVAVKLLLDEHSEDDEAVKRFLREARASVKIRSEHVARVYETGRLESGAPFIVMEFLPGRDLSAVLEERGRLPVQEIAHYLLQACQALAEAHAANIVHRDLKPPNLFMTRRPDGSEILKILDFGISKINSSGTLTKSTTLMGSPYYMSPEQLESPAGVDHRADIWAIGVIMYELASGMRPFDADSLPSLCVSILQSKPQPLGAEQGLPPEFLTVIARCLEKDRERRYRHVGELAHALAPFTPEGEKAAQSASLVLLRAGVGSTSEAPTIINQDAGAATWAHTNREATDGAKGPSKLLLALGGLCILAALGASAVLLRPSPEANAGGAPSASLAVSALPPPEAATDAGAPTIRDSPPRVAPTLSSGLAAPVESASSATGLGPRPATRAVPRVPKPRAAPAPSPTATSHRDPFLRRY